MRRRRIKIEEKLHEPMSDVRKINNILKSLKDLERKGNMCEPELTGIANKLRIVRDLYQTKIKTQQLQYDLKEY